MYGLSSLDIVVELFRQISKPMLWPIDTLLGSRTIITEPVLPGLIFQRLSPTLVWSTAMVASILQRRLCLPSLRTTSKIHLRTKSTSNRMAFSSYLVSPAELNTALKPGPESKQSSSARTIPICGSWFLPNDPQKRTGQQVFREGHVPGARFFDLDKVADTSSPYPHMLPSAEVFKHAMEAMGVEKRDTLVVYDTKEMGIFSAPRVAWTLKVFGHQNVHLLNNYKLYVEQGYPVEEGEQAVANKTEYPLPQLEKGKVIAFEELKSIAEKHHESGKGNVEILDARSQGRWQGTDPEPRPGLESGHIPGSTNVPVPELLDPVTKAFLPAEELREIFRKKSIDPQKPIISSCGTGVTATVIDTALVIAGYREGDRKVYDGSWTEWAQRVKPTENLIVKSS
nr:thiosulfate sulfurtransferase TUM1-like [Quercus suber]POF15564.1 thiosulfate sulfurtransferase tum1 [Quercus suber]